MKPVIIGLAAVALASACDSKAPEGPAKSVEAAAAPTCIKPVSREVALTAPDAKDVLEAQTVGATCEQAALVLTLRKADGSLLWAYSVRATDTWAFEPGTDGQPPKPADGLTKFLDEVLKNVRVGTSDMAPDWPADAERPEDPTGLFHVSPLPREAYLILRAKKIPVMCMQAEMGTSHCMSFDPEYADIANEFYSSSS